MSEDITYNKMRWSVEKQKVFPFYDKIEGVLRKEKKMIVKFDRGLLKVQIAWGLFYSLSSLCLIIPYLLNDFWYENYFGKLFFLFLLLLPLYTGISAVDGIMNFRKTKKLIEVDEQTFTYYGKLFGRKTFEIPLSDIDLVMKDWSSHTADIKRSSSFLYFLKLIEYFLDYQSELDDKKRYRVLMILFKDSETAIKFDKKLSFQLPKKRKYVAKNQIIRIRVDREEVFSDQEMNDYINERNGHDR